MYKSLDYDPVSDLIPGPACRIGVMVLASDQGLEKELSRICPLDVSIHFTRMPLYTSYADREQEYMTDLASAAKLLGSRNELNVVIYGCTSGELRYGHEAIEAAIKYALPDVVVVTPVKALQNLSIKTLSIMSPYNRELNREMRTLFNRIGIAISVVYEFPIEKDSDISRVGEEVFVRFASLILQSKPDCLYIPCNALPVVSQIEKMEAILNIPVLTSTQLVLLDALKHCNYRAISNVLGYGRVFQM